MNILITGASGMIGSRLRQYFTNSGHNVYALVRNGSDADPFRWDTKTKTCHLDPSVPLDVVINLAGESSQGRWTAAKKSEILDSRVNLTRALAEALAASASPPKLFLSASAVGFYGENGDTVLDENAPVGNDFLAEVAREWESATSPCRKAGIRVVNGRLGVVLSPDGGALKEMLLPFKLGLGGRVGNGRQYWSWVSIEELPAMVQHIIDDESLSGAVNLVAPEAVTNAGFAATLGKVLGRPSVMPLPAFVARLMLGEMADAMLLTSIRVSPGKLQDAGYEFRYPSLEPALAALL